MGVIRVEWKRFDLFRIDDSSAATNELSSSFCKNENNFSHAKKEKNGSLLFQDKNLIDAGLIINKRCWN